MRIKQKLLLHLITLFALACVIVVGMKLPEIVLEKSIDSALSKKCKEWPADGQIVFQPQELANDQSGHWQNASAEQRRYSEQLALAYIRQLMDYEVLPKVATDDLQATELRYRADNSDQGGKVFHISLSSPDGQLVVRMHSNNDDLVFFEFMCSLSHEMRNTVPPITAISNLIKHQEGYDGMLFAPNQNSAVLSDEKRGLVFFAENKVENNVYHLMFSQLSVNNK